jgi:REP element-mobilizing transposase RayT
MAYDPGRHNRQSIRLPEYDYRSPGAYFVTICVADRRCLFGTVVNDQMVTNEYGDIVTEEWQRTEQVRDRVTIDTYVVMPISTAGRFTERSEVNHTHGVIIITDPPDDGDGDATDRSPSVSDDAGRNTRGRGSSPMNPYHGENPNRTFGGAIAGSLSTIMRQFKSMVTKRINRLRDTPGGDVWQRNFYERVVRTRAELNRIRQYICRNPAEWDTDRVHPNSGEST